MARELVERPLEKPIVLGDTSSLRFVIEWEAAPSGDTSADVTWGALRASVQGQLVWGTPDTGVRWTWIELLEFLAEAWPHLIYAEGFPEGLRPGDPAEQLQRWRNSLKVSRESDVLSTEYELRAGDDIQEFRETHDLASGVSGVILPSLWLVRDGRVYWLCHKFGFAQAPAGEVRNVLSALAEAICARLTLASDERSELALQEWEAREAIGVDDFVRLGSKLPEDELELLQGASDVRTFWELSDGGSEIPNEETSELLAVARMTGPGSPEALARIIEAVRKVPPSDKSRLDALTLEAQRDLGSRLVGPPPYRSGYDLAQWLRRKLDLSNAAPVDPEGILEDLGVDVRSLTLDASPIDAVACWGKLHGPAVMVNSSGLHAGSRSGRRATLAHEIAHLIVDRSTALPLAEVVGGVVTEPIEQRARAFAAELLLPRVVAASRLQTTTASVKGALGLLLAEYGVSAELAAWQALNARQPLTSEVEKYLRAIVGASR